MESCKYEPALMSFVLGELEEPEFSEIDAHLAHCETCSEQAAEYRQLTGVLSTYERTQPPPEVLEAYRDSLDEIVAVGESPKRTVFLFGALGNLLTRPWRPAMQMALVLCIGVFIGWLLRAQMPATSPGRVENEAGESINASDLKAIRRYISDSQRLLQDVTTMVEIQKDDHRALAASELAQQLLLRTFTVSEKSSQLEIPELLNFLRKVELLLHEIANPGAEQSLDSLSELRDIFEVGGLIEESRRLSIKLNGIKEKNRI